VLDTALLALLPGKMVWLAGMEADLESVEFRPFGCLTSHILERSRWLFRWKRTAFPSPREEFEREIAGGGETAAELSRSTRAGTARVP
jgi:hypothetical protein